MVDTSKIPYDENYKDKCKVAWYSAGRVEPMQLRRQLKKNNDVDEHGRVPTNVMIAKWMREMDWHIWADEMDSKAMILVEDDLILKKAQMLREQAERGFELQTMGMKALREDGFDSASAAVQAVKIGVDIERSSRGIGEMLLKMAKMSDDDLINEIQKELQKSVSSGQVIEVEAEEVPNINDTESPPQE